MKRAAKTVIGPEGNQIEFENWEDKKAIAQILTDHIRSRYPKQKVIEIPEEERWVFYRGNWQEEDSDLFIEELVWERKAYRLNLRTKAGKAGAGIDTWLWAHNSNEQLMVLADYFMPQQEIVHPQHLPIYGESATYGDLQPGTYLCLFHGFHNEIDRKRNTINDNGLGTAGPMIGPLDFVHTTYANDIKIRFASGFYESKEKYGLDAESQLDMADDCVLYNGVQYGDWSVTNYPFPSY